MLSVFCLIFIKMPLAPAVPDFTDKEAGTVRLDDLPKCFQPV
jgi:hypothetical protein